MNLRRPELLPEEATPPGAPARSRPLEAMAFPSPSRRGFSVLVNPSVRASLKSATNCRPYPHEEHEGSKDVVRQDVPVGGVRGSDGGVPASLLDGVLRLESHTRDRLVKVTPQYGQNRIFGPEPDSNAIGMATGFARLALHFGHLRPVA